MSKNQYDFVAVLMDSAQEARGARHELQKLREKSLLELEDAVVSYKRYGKVELDKMVDWGLPGAIGGAWLGILVSALVAIATGGVGTGIVIAGTASGFGTGLAAGLLADVGIPDEEMKSITGALNGDGAILFVLAKSDNTETVLKHMAKFKGEVISSTLSADAEQKINAAFSSSV